MASTAACYALLDKSVIPQVVRPRHWGPQCWRFLHCVTLAYPKSSPTPQQQHEMREFFHALKHVLPCHSCRHDFAQMLEDDPIERHLQSREALSRWLVNKHNEVNIKTGVPVVAYEDAIVRVCTADDAPRTAPPGAQVAPSRAVMQPVTILLLLLLVVGGVGAAWWWRQKRM